MKIEFQGSTRYENVISALQAVVDYIEAHDLLVYDFGDSFGCKHDTTLQTMLDEALSKKQCKRIGNNYHFEPTKCLLDDYSFAFVNE